jgi:colanic acid/amylovoran biosynthesis glycosyltransferase
VYKNIEMTIIGEGPLKNRITRLINVLGLSKEISLPGFIPHKEVYNQMKKSHIFILPSITSSSGAKEGIPNVLMEAQATGLPVISTYHAGIPELVLDGESGYLVKEGDIPNLANNLINLIENPDLRMEFGKKGRKHVEKQFNLDKQVKKLEEIYGQMIC